MNRNILEENNDQDEREIEKYFFNDLNFFAGIVAFIIAGSIAVLFYFLEINYLHHSGMVNSAFQSLIIELVFMFPKRETRMKRKASHVVTSKTKEVFIERIRTETRTLILYTSLCPYN